jgi:hypothetical protein
MDKVKANTPKPPSKVHVKNSRVATALILPSISSIYLSTHVRVSALTDMLQGNNLVASSASSYCCSKYLVNTTVA